MSVRVLFFGSVADRLGRRECSLPADAGMTLSDVVRMAGCDDIRPLLLAVNQQQANNMNLFIHSADEVAVMPPFSGG